VAHRRHLKTFIPKFDVKEIAQAYELHGKLPGIEQKDVEIEFTDQQTLIIKGRTKRSYTKGTPPAGFIKGEVSGAITEGSEDDLHKTHGNNNKDTAVAKTDEGKKKPDQILGF
jgi:HSP20 family protein